MYTISQFATIGRVTVRLLHYYDEIGLLKPARVDPATGYRWYVPEQAGTLTRILQLRDFGLKLDAIGELVNGDPDGDREQAMLISARDSLRQELEQNRTRLDRLDAHLRSRQGLTTEPTLEVQITAIEPQRVAFATAPAAGWGPVNITPVIGPLFDRLSARLTIAGAAGFGPAIAIYEADESGAGEGVLVTAAFVVDDSVGPGDGYDLTVLPAIDQAAVTAHRGSVATIGQSWHALMAWVQANAYQPSGVCRECYWTPPDRPQQEWVTDLQQPVLEQGPPQP